MAWIIHRQVLLAVLAFAVLAATGIVTLVSILGRVSVSWTVAAALVLGSLSIVIVLVRFLFRMASYLSARGTTVAVAKVSGVQASKPAEAVSHIPIV